MSRFPRVLSRCLGTSTLVLSLALAAVSTWAQTPVVKLQPAALEETAGLAWTELATDEPGDEKSPRLPDAKSLSVHYDPNTDFVWFRIGLHQAPPPDWLGLNIAADTDQDQSNGLNWWGKNSGFRFDRLVTVWVFRIGSGYMGTVGFTDADGASAGAFDRLGRGGLKLSVDREGRAFLVGFERKRLDEDRKCNLIVTVGSPFMANDDLPHEGFVRLEL
jgi:hypothetical protein